LETQANAAPRVSHLRALGAEPSVQRGAAAPTMELRGTSINDEADLEREADLMGSRVLRVGASGSGVAAQRARRATPHGVAQRRARLQQSLPRSPRGQAQMELAQALNGRPSVLAHTRRAQALSAARGPVAQRFPWERATAVGGMTAGAYLGSYLDPVLPYYLGTLGGGLLGGVGGYLAPSFTRWLLSKPLAQEINRDDRRYRTWNTPQQLADQLAASSTAFRELRAMANEAVRTAYGKDLSYEAAPEGLGSSAAYGQGTVRVDESYHPSVTVQNLVFETANAAQTAFFNQVRADWQDDSILEKSLQHYAEMLDRDPGELGGLAEEYAEGDKHQRRSLLQEWGEWESLELARDALGQLHGMFESETAEMFWDLGFGRRLGLKSFGEYYEEYGRGHRAAVEKSFTGSKKEQ
jgi:hypothetical protein